MLQGVVRCLWASDATAPRVPTFERMLPIGAMHIVLRFDDPVTIFDDPADREAGRSARSPAVSAIGSG